MTLDCADDARDEAAWDRIDEKNEASRAEYREGWRFDMRRLAIRVRDEITDDARSNGVLDRDDLAELFLEEFEAARAA